tara:strand:+ start:291 stop:695 length:405 start_codon:yes stop_codon:yes gene_type:complete
MPKKPTDTLQGFRIELQDSERELLQHFATSYRIQTLTGSNGVFDELADFTKVIKILASIGGLLELLGITDVVDFDDEIKAQVMEAVDKVKENAKQGEYNDEIINFITDIRNPITSILFPGTIPFRAADYVRDNV